MYSWFHSYHFFTPSHPPCFGLFYCFSSIGAYKDPVNVLERNEGAAWKLIFKLLAKGRLYDNDKEKPLQITGSGLVRENKVLFSDTYSN